MVEKAHKVHMIPNVTHHHQNLTELHRPHCKQINVTSCDLWSFPSSGHFCTNNGTACTIDTTTSTHQFHGVEKMKPSSLLPFSQVFIIGPCPQQVKLRHWKRKGIKQLGYWQYRHETAIQKGNVQLTWVKITGLMGSNKPH